MKTETSRNRHSRWIDISDCTVSAKKGIEIRWSEDVTLRNVDVDAADGKPLVTSNVKNLIEE